ncbi:MAG: hypothetical protein NkDv07_0389 [Candidatus Improbicoccus devescovinae]|nr:MAG: hypothetical protein NkDv07_0389 [Candidatus Improbicoccus devescovinae]
MSEPTVAQVQKYIREPTVAQKIFFPLGIVVLLGIGALTVKTAYSLFSANGLFGTQGLLQTTTSMIKNFEINFNNKDNGLIVRLKKLMDQFEQADTGKLIENTNGFLIAASKALNAPEKFTEKAMEGLGGSEAFKNMVETLLIFNVTLAEFQDKCEESLIPGIKDLGLKFSGLQTTLNNLVTSLGVKGVAPITPDANQSNGKPGDDGNTPKVGRHAQVAIRQKEEFINGWHKNKDDQ